MAGVRSTYLGEAIGLPRQTARMLAQGEVVSLHKGCEDNLVVDGDNTPTPPNRGRGSRLCLLKLDS